MFVKITAYDNNHRDLPATPCVRHILRYTFVAFGNLVAWVGELDVSDIYAPSRAEATRRLLEGGVAKVQERWKLSYYSQEVRGWETEWVKDMIE